MSPSKRECPQGHRCRYKSFWDVTLAEQFSRELAKITAIWAVEAALIAGILLVVIFGYRNIHGRLAEGSRTAVGGAILAAMNTASEYGCFTTLPLQIDKPDGNDKQ